MAGSNQYTQQTLFGFSGCFINEKGTFGIVIVQQVDRFLHLLRSQVRREQDRSASATGWNFLYGLAGDVVEFTVFVRQLARIPYPSDLFEHSNGFRVQPSGLLRCAIEQQVGVAVVERAEHFVDDIVNIAHRRAGRIGVCEPAVVQLVADFGRHGVRHRRKLKRIGIFITEEIGVLQTGRIIRDHQAARLQRMHMRLDLAPIAGFQPAVRRPALIDPDDINVAIVGEQLGEVGFDHRERIHGSERIVIMRQSLVVLPLVAAPQREAVVEADLEVAGTERIDIFLNNVGFAVLIVLEPGDIAVGSGSIPEAPATGMFDSQHGIFHLRGNRSVGPLAKIQILRIEQ